MLAEKISILILLWLLLVSHMLVFLKWHLCQQGGLFSFVLYCISDRLKKIGLQKRRNAKFLDYFCYSPWHGTAIFAVSLSFFFRSGCIPQELSDYNVYMSWLLKCLTNVSSFIINKCTYIGSDNPVNRYVKKILMCMVMFKCLSI